MSVVTRKNIWSFQRRFNIKKRAFLQRFGIDSDKGLVNRFHKLYYDNFQNTWQNTRWLGTTVYKCPLDLWVYQEIIFETKPDIIIECGTAKGGSAYYMAFVCDVLNNGKIITIDIEAADGKPQHDRVTYIVGSSIAQETQDQLKKLIPEGSKIMVILDSDHSGEHVLKELKIFNKMVTKECYLIVEDTNLNGHPVIGWHGPGPMEALEEFLKLEASNDFAIDMSKQKYYLTFNPKGYLKKR